MLNLNSSLKRCGGRRNAVCEKTELLPHNGTQFLCITFVSATDYLRTSNMTFWYMILHDMTNNLCQWQVSNRFARYIINAIPTAPVYTTKSHNFQYKSIK